MKSFVNLFIVFVSENFLCKLALVTAIERFIKDNTYGKYRIKYLITVLSPKCSLSLLHWTFYLTEGLLKKPK